MIKIIAIDREYGSGAADIADTLAARLGWKLWDELLTVEIARRLGCDCTVVEPLDRPAEGNILVCCSQPIRDVVIDLWSKSTSLTKCPRRIFVNRRARAFLESKGIFHML